MARMTKDKLRSREWFANPDDPEMTALYPERYLNDGLTRDERQGGKPIIAIAQTGSDRDLTKGTADILVALDDLAESACGYDDPDRQSPWQQYFRELVGCFDKDMTLRDATKDRDTARKGIPRDSH